MKVIIVTLCFLLYIAPSHANNDIEVVYNEPKNTEESTFKKQLEASSAVHSIITFINDNFILPTKLTFSFGAEDGPLYDSDQNEVFIPYSFLEEVEHRFLESEYSENGVSAEEATMDALMHTLFHEFAHAMIYMHKIPVLGKEEDAADSLAVFLLVEFFDNGQEIAISAADLFDLESNDTEHPEAEDYWGEHSLNKQRYYATLCHVYGSDPETYSDLLDKNISDERAELCIDEYEQISQSWLTLLKPHMKLQQ